VRGREANLSKRKSRKNQAQSKAKYYLLGLVAIIVVVGFLYATFSPAPRTKPVILYVNQGNGVVNGSNFAGLLETASSHGFDTIFFQIYRSGTLLFTDNSLNQLVASAHGKGLKIFFALYFTNSTQKIPVSIYRDGEDGINLDMSTLSIDAQTALFDSLSSAYSGKTAITTTNPTLLLNPGMLIVETYGAGNGQYIHHGIIASVGVFATSSRQDYDQQFHYALDNSDGVMVFDYAGLLKAGY
jgi:hypothetical protein